MAEKAKYEIDMCSGSILKKMLIFTLPLMCSGILQLLFNAADIVVVGRFAGDNSLAAVGSNTALINLLTNLFVGLSIGSNVAAAREYGAKKFDNVSSIVHTSIITAIVSGLAMTAIGIIFAEKILIIMQTPEDVLPLAVTYLRIYFIGMTGTMLYNFGSALLRAVGDTKRPLYYLLISGVINVILNLVFVVGFKMDVAGVAIATVISECISAALVILCMVKNGGAVRIERSKLKFSGSFFKKIIQIGLPAGFQGIIFALSNVVIQSAVNGFGNIVVAGNSAAANIEGFVYIAMNSFYQSTLSFVSQNMGAGKDDRIVKILLRGQLCVIIVGLLLGNGAVLFGRQLLSIYSDSSEVIDAGMVRLGIISRTYALCGIMDVMVGALRGIGSSVLPMVVSLIGACGLRLVWIFTVFQIPEYHKITTVYLSYPITWIITLTVHIICFALLWNRHKKKAALRCQIQ